MKTLIISKVNQYLSLLASRHRRFAHELFLAAAGPQNSRTQAERGTSSSGAARGPGAAAATC